MIQEQQKNGTAWFSVELIFEWCEDALVFRAFVFIFLFRSNGKKKTWLRTILVTVMVIISKMTLWKLIDISCSKFSATTRNTDNGIWKNLTAGNFTGIDQNAY